MSITRDADRNARLRQWPLTWGGAGLLAMAVVGLSVLAIRYEVPFSGLAALLVMFLGSGWLAIRVLRGRWTRFDRPPAAGARRPG